MRAVVLEQPRQFAVHEVAEPAALQADEALVRVHRVGICGTDISGYLGKFPFYSYPRIPGHELGVEVVEVGTEVTEVRAGDRCAVEPYINNPNSFASRRGRPNCCNDLQVLGVHTDGGLRPFFVVPAQVARVSPVGTRAIGTGRNTRHRLPRDRSRKPRTRRMRAGHWRRPDRFVRN